MIQNTQINRHQLGALTGASRCENYYELHFATGEVAHFYILADGIFRLLLDSDQNFDEERTPFIELTKFNRTAFENSKVRATHDSLIIQTGNYQIIFGQKPAVMSIFDESLHRTRMAQAKPLEFAGAHVSELLVQNKNEFYFGGGLQNGYFSHKGHKIEIKQDRITGKGGVITQVPFFWSNAGYGEIRNTARPGSYDFGKNDSRLTTLSHEDPVFDCFYLVGTTSQAILAKFYALTGKPVLLPKYMLGLGHIGNFCTTLWKPSQAKERNATKIGNNYYTRTSDEQSASGRASLNGEEDYQFSARAMLDRYRAAHFGLSWFVPNFGVSSHNQQALSFFNDYAFNQGVHPGFWHDEDEELPEKTAFTFTSRSEQVASDTKNLQSILQRKRPLVLTNNGFMGMQTKSALVFGDTGGNWENIATQVAGIIGSNLSGQPLVGVAVDGVYGGGNAQISVRDFEWKTFTPLLFHLDNQGEFSKTPFAFNKRVTEINRSYLQLRKLFESYLYTLNSEARCGKAIVRPLFIAFPNERINYAEQFSSEFMLGDSLLIAPITNGRENENGDSRKDNLYLPGKHTMWIDLFTGEKFAGGRVYNNLIYPIWHLPVFVRGGSIFDFGKRNYVIYPQGNGEATVYDDNNLTDFEQNHCETHISSSINAENLKITIDPVIGAYPSLGSEQPTNLTVLCDSYPDNVLVKINDQAVPMQVYGTAEAFAQAREGIFYNTSYCLPGFNQYQDKKQTALQIKLAGRKVANTKIEVIIKNFTYSSKVLVHAITSGLLPSPKLPSVDSSKITAHSFELAWSRTGEVQVEINNLLYEGISGNSFTFHELTPNTRYIIRMRYASGKKVSEWSDLFGVITKHAAKDYAIEDIAVSSNFASEQTHPLKYLTDLKLASEWQTTQAVSPENPLELTFRFADVEKLSRMSFVPRNIDHTGDPLDVSLAISTDGENFTSYADHLKWKADSKNKVVGLRDVRAKSVRMTIYQSSGSIVAAREVIFFKAKN